MLQQAETVYLRLRKKVALPPDQPVLLGQVAQLMATPEAVEARLRQLPLCRPQEREGNCLLIDMMLIVRQIKRILPQAQVELFGEPHALVELKQAETKPNILFVVLMWLLLFIGSGLAIMNFHEDVSMLETQQRLFFLITGQQSEHPYWLQIPYCFGLGAGMALFFNQLFKKKFSDEPSPLELEMFLYQENLNRCIITDEYQKIHDNGDKTP